MRVLHFSVFYGSQKRHGGTKRSEQLVELLGFKKDIYLICQNVSRKQLVYDFLFNPHVSFKVILFCIYLFLFRGLSLKGLFKYSVQCVSYILKIDNFNPDFIYHETAPGVSQILMHYFIWKKFKYIVIPHNIEFMVPGQNNHGFRSLSHAFSFEIKCFSSAVNVWSISEFDKAILNCFDVKSKVIQYFPVESDLLFFDQIRSSRETVIKEDYFLLLGTVLNTPTLRGIETLIRNYNTNNKKIIVAGYGTQFLSDYESANVAILGQINELQMTDLLVKCKALIINQPQTTGFLTKLIEFNLCNIPIILTSDYYQASDLCDYGINKCSLDDLNDKVLLEPKKHFKKPVISFNDL